MDNGCPKCEELPGGDMCLDCQLEMADWEVSRWMRIREELEKKKEKEQHRISQMVHNG